MSLAGDAIIAIWQDLVPGTKEEYLEWHTLQHVPERLGIPGFNRARRYRALEGGPEFFTLYEASTYEAVSGPDYQARLDHPTDWTRRIMPAFRNMARSVCHVLTSQGESNGVLLKTVRPCADVSREGILERIRQMQPAAGVALHLGCTDPGATNASSFEKTFRVAQDLVSPVVLLIEADAGEKLERALHFISPTLGQDFDAATYSLELSRFSAAGHAYGGPAEQNVQTPILLN